MKKYGLISTIVLIVLTNVVVLAGVAYNRSGEPDATVQLTERELHWQKYWGWTNKEDTGIYLNLKWNMPGYHYRIWARKRNDSWLNQQKLAELGFNTDFPLDDKKASRYYSRQLPRQSYVVLEFDGDAYKIWLEGARNQIKILEKDLAQEKESKKREVLENDIIGIKRNLVSKSHLFAIDAGLNAQTLRMKYSDKSKYIITSAVFDISMSYAPVDNNDPQSTQKPYLSGWIRKISIPQIHVTSDYRSFFISDIKTYTKTYLPRDKPLSELEPRYQVTLNYGQRYEPWIAGVEKLK
jgi:hypothetical protein